MQDIWTYLKNATKPIVIYGMGDGCDKIIAVCNEKGIPVSGIFASDEYVRDKVVHGFPLTSYGKAKESFGDMIVLLAFGVFRKDLMQKIVDLSKKEELYAPEVPPFGGEIFDSAYYEENRKKLMQAREMLSDDLSGKVFDALLDYKLTGRIQPLITCETEKSNDLKRLVPYRSGDVYADLGAYDGDTVLEWDALHPDHGAIYAAEPNPKTFIKLCENTKTVQNVHPLPYAIWNKDEPLTFNGKSGRSAAVSNEGKVAVEGRRVDGLIRQVHFMKFDVEGAEKEAIEGSREIIKNQAPALCISAYHRTEDLFAIPLQVKEIQPKYKVYLRHSPYIPAWDTQFYFIAD
ncbi:MAG: FkbM family methyltransferase [Clostridia bacterium]|nr:FkbM family methyltransferase [Clostridia bacterium]